MEPSVIMSWVVLIVPAVMIPLIIVIGISGYREHKQAESKLKPAGTIEYADPVAENGAEFKWAMLWREDGLVEMDIYYKLPNSDWNRCPHMLEQYHGLLKEN